MAPIRSAARIASCHWLPDEELAVYSEAFARTGFQGGLQHQAFADSFLSGAHGPPGGLHAQQPFHFPSRRETDPFGNTATPAELARFLSGRLARPRRTGSAGC